MSQIMRKILSTRVRKLEKKDISKRLRDYLVTAPKPEKWTKTIVSKTATILPAKFNFPFRRTIPLSDSTKSSPTSSEKQLTDKSLEAVHEALNARFDQLERVVAAVELKLNRPSLFSRLQAVISEKMTVFFEKSVPKRITSEYENKAPKQIEWIKNIVSKVTKVKGLAFPPQSTGFVIVPDEKDKSPYTKTLESANKQLLAKYEAMERKLESMNLKISENQQKRLYKYAAASFIALFLVFSKFFRKHYPILVASVMILTASATSQLKS